MSRDDKLRRELYPLIEEAIEKGYADLGCGLDISVAQAITPNIYNSLMRKGYVKASEVAREIFEEADKIFMATCLSLETYKAWCELKKKYTEGE